MNDIDHILSLFFDEPNRLFLEYEDRLSELVKTLVEIPMMDYLHRVAIQPKPELNGKNIPQFSSLDACSCLLTQTLELSGDFGPDFDTLGGYLSPTSPSEGARVKYGENHAKTGNLLQLCEIKRDRRVQVHLSTIGALYHKIPEHTQAKLLTRLMLRTEIFIYFYQEAFKRRIDIANELSNYLSESTAYRRAPNVRCFITRVLDNKEHNLDFIKSSLGL
ncbi:MAG: hypothetical protein ACRCSG_00410 [Cellulosilyticaceae bacterium]